MSENNLSDLERPLSDIHSEITTVGHNASRDGADKVTIKEMLFSMTQQMYFLHQTLQETNHKLDCIFDLMDKEPESDPTTDADLDLG